MLNVPEHTPPTPTTQVATQGRAAPDSGPLGTLSIRTSPAAVVALSLCPKCSSAPVLQRMDPCFYILQLTWLGIPTSSFLALLRPPQHPAEITTTYSVPRTNASPWSYSLFRTESTSLSVQSPRSPGQEGEDDVSTRRFS